MGIFGGGKNMSAHDAIDSVIGKKAKFKGELNSAGAVSVEGEFEGKLIARGEVIIARGSKILGDVSGKSAVVSGRVDGNITTSESLEITKSGKVRGDMVSGRITIEEGSSYRGKVRVETGDAKEKDIKEEIEIIQEDPKSVADKAVAQAQMF